MTGWFACAVAALVLMGAQRFLYKVAAERSCDTVLTTLSFMATVTVISAAAFFAGGDGVKDVPALFLVGLANSLAFLAATYTHIEALKRLPATTAYPLVRLDAILVVIISMVFFHERLAGRQGIGIMIAVAAAVLVARDRNPVQTPSAPSCGGFLFVAMAILAGTAAAVSSRFAVLHTDKAAFMAVSYGFSTMFAVFMGSGSRPGKTPEVFRPSLLIGVSMGILNVAGYYAYLEGLSRGPLSLVTVITGMHFVVAIVFSLVVYRERLTPASFAGIVLAALSLVLIRV
jgi:drug/metabolite transporter (DMT)-like permease